MIDKILIMNMFRFKKILIISAFFTSTYSYAQVKGGAIEDAEITVEKDRKVIMPDVVKPKERPIQVKPNVSDENKQVVFDIAERKVTVAPPKFVLNAQEYEPKDTTIEVFENFLKVGAGNYGRLYLEGLLNTPSSNLGALGLNFKHNAAPYGPVSGKSSGHNVSEIGLNGKYVAGLFKLDGGLSFDRNDYYFYGRKDIATVDRNNIRQTVNKFGMKLGLENANKDASLDYSLHTGINFLKDRLEAREVEWITNFNFTLPVTENFYALVNTDAFITQRSDSVSNNRNLMKVRPTFIWKNETIAVTFGMNVANEKDYQVDDVNKIKKDINRTKAFPLINIDYFIANGIYAFAGYNGDINRNSLTTLLAENQWLKRKVNLLNTEKSMDVYAGAKGEVEGVNYDIKLSYAKYKDFYVFNNTPETPNNFLKTAKVDTSKFDVLYDNGTLKNFKLNTNVYYKFNEIWRSSLKLEANTYSPEKLKKVYHLPNFQTTWSNTLAFKNKLFIGTDIYYLSKMKSYNSNTDKEVSLKAILDLNAKMNYQFSNHLSGFVYLNNLLGKSYQRYTNYPQQSLNFLVGLSFGFSTKEYFN
jgi:hypothetical protein